MSEFDKSFDTWFSAAKKLVDDHMIKTFPDSPNLRRTLKIGGGRKYIKIVNCRESDDNTDSVWAFIDKTNGDVLKAASWKSPHKTPRGNIFDSSNGMGSIGVYGPAYMRG